MKESTYLRSVNKKLPAEIYVWKIADQFTSGVPDCWYSSPDGDLFVEWKYAKSLKRQHTPSCSELQKKWLNDRHAEGRNVAVIVGSPDGCLIFINGEWNSAKKVTTLLSKDQTAEWIAERIKLCAKGAPCSNRKTTACRMTTSVQSSPCLSSN